jgi:hypothetical protein
MTVIWLRVKEVHRITLGLEDIGCLHLAHPMTLAQVQIHFDSHEIHLHYTSGHYLLRLRYLTLHGCASCTTIFE